MFLQNNFFRFCGYHDRYNGANSGGIYARSESSGDSGDSQQLRGFRSGAGSGSIVVLVVTKRLTGQPTIDWLMGARGISRSEDHSLIDALVTGDNMFAGRQAAL